jgi:F-type H+-transporting ATPase subunit epsilon
MARNRFAVEILTPEGEVFNDEVEMVSTRTTIGSIGILAHHSPLLAQLAPTELRLVRSDTDIVRFAQAEGYLQFADNHALVLVEEAISPDALDAAELQTRLDEARAAAQRATEGSEEQARALRDARRAEAFLLVAGAGA